MRANAVNPSAARLVIKEPEECPVCYESYSKSIKGRVTLACNHGFCWTCVNDWQQRKKNTCPICRREIVIISEAKQLEAEEGFLEQAWGFLGRVSGVAQQVLYSSLESIEIFSSSIAQGIGEGVQAAVQSLVVVPALQPFQVVGEGIAQSSILDLSQQLLDAQAQIQALRDYLAHVQESQIPLGQIQHHLRTELEVLQRRLEQLQQVPLERRLEGFLEFIAQAQGIQEQVEAVLAVEVNPAPAQEVPPVPPANGPFLAVYNRFPQDVRAGIEYDIWRMGPSGDLDFGRQYIQNISRMTYAALPDSIRHQIEYLIWEMEKPSENDPHFGYHEAMRLLS